jgi:poly(3-hydroxybutyrate) depolymerase
MLLAAGAVRGAEVPAPVTQPAVAAAPQDAAGILHEFFAEENASRRVVLADKFAAVAPKKWSDLKALLHRAAPRGDLNPGRQEFATPAADGLEPIKYVLRVPAGYKGHEPQGWPLVIALPGTGGNGEGLLGTAEGLLGPDVDRYLVAGATPPDLEPFTANKANAEFALSVLADVRRRANVDSDRAVLMGVSKGGFSTWNCVLFSPAEWAGAIPIASYPLTEAGLIKYPLYLPNVLGLSIQAHWGANDVEAGQNQGISTYSREVAADMKRLGATKFEGIEYPGEGHGVNVKAEKIRAFLAAARRDAFPEQSHLIFHRLYQGRAGLVRATAAAKADFDFFKRRTVRVTKQEDVLRALNDIFLAEAFELTVRMTPAGNAIAIVAKNIKEIELELPAEKLDFSKPFRITINGRSIQEKPRKLDWAELLETARRTYDFERLVGGRLRISVASGIAR